MLCTGLKFWEKPRKYQETHETSIQERQNYALNQLSGWNKLWHAEKYTRPLLWTTRRASSQNDADGSCASKFLKAPLPTCVVWDVGHDEARRACHCPVIGSLEPHSRPPPSTRSHSRAIFLCMRTQMWIKQLRVYTEGQDVTPPFCLIVTQTSSCGLTTLSAPHPSSYSAAQLGKSLKGPLCLWLHRWTLAGSDLTVSGRFNLNVYLVFSWKVRFMPSCYVFHP